MDYKTEMASFVSDVVAEAISGLERGLSPSWVAGARIAERLDAAFHSHGSMDSRRSHCELSLHATCQDQSVESGSPLIVPHAHPVLAYWLAGNPDVAMVSNVVSDRRDWRNSEAYSLLTEALGMTETGGIRLRSAGRSAPVVGFARDVDFTSDDRALLACFESPLNALRIHAEYLARVRRVPAAGDVTVTRSAHARTVDLTPRELQVLDHLATGMLASSIAARLSISPRTVHRHLGNIYAKLGTHDRLTTVLRADAVGILAGRS